MATKLKHTTKAPSVPKQERTAAAASGKGLLAGLGPAELERVRTHMAVHEAEGKPLKPTTAKRT